MESEEIRSENRGCKRGRGRSACPDRWDLVGRRVKKDFVGIGVFFGKIVKYKRGGLYRVDYEDGDREDLEYEEVCAILVKEDRSGIGGSAVESGAVKQQELGQLVPKSQDQPAPDAVDGVDQVDDASAVSKLSSADVESDADSSSDSCGSEGTQLPLLVLPPSSGDIGVPEESVSYLFSVYNVLRSFSFGLFLSPFSLDDFVGSLNCMSQNSLLDAVHVSLMRALRRDFEMGSPDGSLSENAPKCLRRLDWSLLDSLTWPAYVVEYLLRMGYTKGPEWKGFHEHVLNSEYFTLPVQTKLRILQILCDNVLESAELRTEINMRLRTEVGTEVDADASLASENGPRRVHPRYAKTSACKDPGAMDNILEPSELKPPQSRSATDPNKPIEPVVNVSGDADDGNGDECRLCSMDGSLLCCDGCPSVYHSRCIGLNKAFLPEGDWFCPECVVNRIGPTCSKIGAGLRGAEVFGIDPHERAFLGTCNYLLVLDTSINAGRSTRYYNQNDVLRVLQVLHSSAQHSSLYSQICKGILQYWDMSRGILLSHPAGVESEINLLDEKEDAMGSSTACAQSVKGSKVPTDAVMSDNCLSNATESNVETGALSFQENGCHETGVNGTSLYSACQTDLPDRQRDNFIAGEKSNDPFALVTAELMSQQVRHLGTESAISAGSLVSPIDPDGNHQSSGERSAVLEIATCASREAESSGREDADSLVLQVTNSIPGISQECKQHKYGYGGKSKGAVSDGTSYFGTSFKPQTYLNQYILGDVAASASANLARLASESKPSESRSASKSNPKKVDSEKLSLQVKAFAAASTHFLWPSLEKKLLEIPREKCGWCMACKGPATSRKGCLLNAAASNALKGAAKVLGVVRPKIGDGPLASIATYVLHMEESLRGLIVGSLLTVSYRRQWRKQVELVSTCRLLKFLLLELEENLNALTLSGGWVKPVDDWSIEFSIAPTSTSVAGPTQKRGPSTRRNKKQSSVSETTPEASSKSCVNWWRGGKLSKLVFQKGILPHSIVKKAARQGGYKGISGINYNQGSEIPRRSRRLAWRAAVEMSKNASQLALQVRNLDAHIRWSDLIRPDQGPQDGKAPGIETSTFRNAVVHDKKVVEGKTRYALTFGPQKHLPSRIMKNIIEVEQSLDGKERMWFSENHIPLYLIKDYEERAEKFLLPSTVKPLKCFPKIRRNPLKSCNKDIFSYLLSREDKYPCALCQQDLLLRKAVKCSGCQGYCHEDCTVQSTDMKGEFGFVFTCNRCYKSLSAMLDSYKKVPVVQPSIQGQHQVSSNFKGIQQDGFHHVSKIAQPDGYHRISRVVQQDSFHHVPLPSRNMENHLETKPSTPNPNLDRKNRYGMCLTNGLIWKKKKALASEAGAEFRLKNILLKGVADADLSMGPVCTLCSEPYNPDLMYIRCQSCTHWYHADAVQLKEDQIFNLEGFRCCKCRRKLSPICPYTKPERMKQRKAASKQGNITKPALATAFGKPVVSDSPVLHTTTENVVIEDDDPLLFSLENVEPITEETPEVKPEWNGTTALFQTSQKLPVRRQGKQENEEPASHEMPLMNNIKEEASYPRLEWEFPPSGEMTDFEGGSLANMEFEPQTYFSFTELLATGEERMDGLFDVPADISGNWCNSSVCDDMGTVCRAMSPYNPFETYEMDMGPAPQEFIVATKPAADLIPCQLCAHTEPAPDLCCQNCNILIHSHCSPWDDAPSWDNRWKCGRCRDWR